ncbi:MAG: hypothetical protein JWP89_3706 [Schlesneria sp.]|nr:hypothetical protein [Schlesneria sp.]
MQSRLLVRLIVVVLALAFAASPLRAYIHFPPMTMPKMCKHSTHIRALRVSKHDSQKGVIVYEVVETLKGQKIRTMSFKHLIRKEVDGVQPILDWVGDKKSAVLFSIESTEIACGYVFIDDYCYSVDYNNGGEYWLLIRAEPNMSACYFGSAEKLQGLLKEILEEKDVPVPTKEPASPTTKQNENKRIKEVTDVLNENRNLTPNGGK